MTEATLDGRLSLLVRACIAAGEMFSQRIETDKQITMKSSLSDVVTEVDKACETLIRSLLHQIVPTDVVLGEEGTAPGAAAATQALADVVAAARLWIVDPLDGTTNFVQRLPLSVVSIAYVEHGVVQLGGIYDPYHDELFYAVAGHGAYLLTRAARTLCATGQVVKDGQFIGTRLQVSGIESIHRAVVSSGFPTRAADKDLAFRRGMEIVRHAKSLRGLGAAALHLAYVAAGRLDAFWEYDLNAWDIAAGALLVGEAGGAIMEIDGDSYTLAVRNIIACSTTTLVTAIQARLATDIPVEGLNR